MNISVSVLKDRFKTNLRQQTCFAMTTWKDVLKFLNLHSTLAELIYFTRIVFYIKQEKNEKPI